MTKLMHSTTTPYAYYSSTEYEEFVYSGEELTAGDESASPSFRLDEHVTGFEYYFYIVSGVVGSLLNLGVLLLGVLHVDTRDKPCQLIVINMTCADFLTCLVYCLTRPYLNRFPAAACYPYYVCIFTSQLSSCLNLLWLNVDKLTYIRLPLQYYRLVNRPRVLCLNAVSWLVPVSIGLAVYTQLLVRHPCSAVEISPLIYLPICALYAVLITSSFAISAVIYCIARNSTQRIGSHARSRLFQRLFFVFSSTLWTFATCLPYRLLYLTNALCTVCHSESYWGRYFYRLTDAFFSFLVIGTVCNPVVTVVTQRLYRRCVAMYVCRVLVMLRLKRPATNDGVFTGGTDTHHQGFTELALRRQSDPASNRTQKELIPAAFRRSVSIMAIKCPATAHRHRVDEPSTTPNRLLPDT